MAQPGLAGGVGFDGVGRQHRVATSPDAPVGPLVLGMGWFPDQTGGLTRYLRSLTEAMVADDDGDPRVVVVGPVAAPPQAVRAVGAQDQPLPLRLAHFALAAHQEVGRSPIVDSHFALYAFPCLFLPSIRRLPLVVHFHGPWAAEFVANRERPGLEIEVKRRLERWVYRRAGAVVVLSTAFARIVVEDFDVDPGKVHVIPPGVDVARFSPDATGDVRAALDIPSATWVAVTARRLVPRMGLDVLLQAWAEVDRADRTLLVVGDGEARPELERLTATLGLGSRVRFLGQVSDDALVACYRAADVSIVPSLALEGFGLVVLEALACGVPVIGTDVGGLAETLGRLDPGLVVGAGDARALTSRLTDAVSGSRPLPSAQQCRRFAESFSWPEVARHHRELYAALLHGAR